MSGPAPRSLGRGWVSSEEAITREVRGSRGWPRGFQELDPLNSFVKDASDVLPCSPMPASR